MTPSHENPYAGLVLEMRQKFSAGPPFVWIWCCNLGHEHVSDEEGARCVLRQAIDRDARYGSGCRFDAMGECVVHDTCPMYPWKR